MHRIVPVFVLLLLLVPVILTAQQKEFDECHAGFAAYIGASPYILNPAVAGRRVLVLPCKRGTDVLRD